MAELEREHLTPEQVDAILAGAAEFPATPENIADFLVALARRNGTYRQGAYAAAAALDRLCPDNASKVVAAIWLIVNATRGEKPQLRDRLRLAVPHIVAALGKGDA